jgi:serine O-acetyltransferase
MDRVTKADLYRYGGLQSIKGFIKGMHIPGFWYTFLLRKVMLYKRQPVRGIFFRLIKLLFPYRGFQISQEAQIGEGFHLYHRGTVIIGPIKIGKNCDVSHNVTIGRAYKNCTIGRPTIDDYVCIGAGSVLVGEINIGKNVLIAPNSFINFDVP